jgi:REP element-mobilizing transposase RayT
MMRRTQRRRTELKHYTYENGGECFITVNTHHRRPILSTIKNATVELSAAGNVVEDQILAWNRQYPWLHVIRYCVMPDHIHILVSWNPPEDLPLAQRNFINAMTWLKARITTHCKYDGVIERTDSLWHRTYYETRIRDVDHRQRVSRYIDANPRKWPQSKAAKRAAARE